MPFDGTDNRKPTDAIAKIDEMIAFYRSSPISWTAQTFCVGSRYRPVAVCLVGGLNYSVYQNASVAFPRLRKHGRVWDELYTAMKATSKECYNTSNCIKANDTFFRGRGS